MLYLQKVYNCGKSLQCVALATGRLVITKIKCNSRKQNQYGFKHIIVGAIFVSVPKLLCAILATIDIFIQPFKRLRKRWE